MYERHEDSITTHDGRMVKSKRCPFLIQFTVLAQDADTEKFMFMNPGVL
jgi:hypothetical protein